MPTPVRELDWYQAPRYYDLVFDQLTARELRFLEALYERHAPTRRRRVLEPACGSGRLLAPLAARGYRVTGFDLSEAMVAYTQERLRRRRLRGRISVADMASFRAPAEFDLAFNLVSTFKYLLSEAAARRHLERVAEALVPGGVYVLGFHLSDYDDGSPDRERWAGSRGKTRVVCDITSAPPDRRRRREAMRSRLTVTEPAGRFAFETRWSFRTYDAPQFERLLDSVPALEHIATHDFRYDPDREQLFGGEQLDAIVVLQKRRRT